MKTGELCAVVEKTGKDSFLGKSAALVASVTSSGHFQKVIYGNAAALVVAAIICVVVILAVQLSRGINFGDVLQLCVIVLVAAIPITLPVVATGTLAVGSRKLAADNCVVSRLASIEEMAGMDILCSDKTGTLTKVCFCAACVVLSFLFNLVLTLCVEPIVRRRAAYTARH